MTANADDALEMMARAIAENVRSECEKYLPHNVDAVRKKLRQGHDIDVLLATFIREAVNTGDTAQISAMLFFALKRVAELEDQIESTSNERGS